MQAELASLKAKRARALRLVETTKEDISVLEMRIVKLAAEAQQHNEKILSLQSQASWTPTINDHRDAPLYRVIHVTRSRLPPFRFPLHC